MGSSKVCCQQGGTKGSNCPRECHSQQPMDGPDQGRYNRTGVIWASQQLARSEEEEDQGIRNGCGASPQTLDA